MLDKARRWLDHGVRVVWIVDPLRESVLVVSPGRPEHVLGRSGILVGGDVLPGFAVPVRAIFAD